MSDFPTRQAAWDFLTEFTKSQSLIRHALAVEAAMRAYATKFGEDVEKWGVTGLIHDFDYEQNPSEETHVHVGIGIMKDRGFPEELIRAVASHADYMGVTRESLMEKTLYAVDELSGFLIAAALIRPSKKLEDLPVKSVKKRFKDKGFAKAVDREAIFKGAEDLNIPMEEHIRFMIDAMVPIADSLGV